MSGHRFSFELTSRIFAAHHATQPLVYLTGYQSRDLRVFAMLRRAEMGDLRDHDLPKRYRVCCLSCCEHDTKPFGADRIHYCKEKTEDEENDCASLKKTVGDKDLKCRCLIFKLPKKPEKKERWRLVPEEARVRDDDDQFHFDCFCVVDTDAK